MAEYDVYDSSGNHVGTFREDNDYGDGEPLKPKRVYKRKLEHKIFRILAIIALIGHFVSYFVGMFDSSDLIGSLGMFVYILPSIALLTFVIVNSTRFINAATKVEDYILNSGVQVKNESEGECVEVSPGMTYCFSNDKNGESENEPISLDNTIKLRTLRDLLKINENNKECERLNNAIKKSINGFETEDDNFIITLDSLVDNYLNKGKKSNIIAINACSYLLYVVTLAYIIMENTSLYDTKPFYALSYPLNMCAIMLFAISVYKFYKFIISLGIPSGKASIEIVKILVPIFSLVLILCVILDKTIMNISYSTFALCMSLTDLFYLIKTNSIKKKLKMGLTQEIMKSGKIPFAKLLAIETGLFILFLGIICGMSLGIEPVCQALKDFDAGISKDLSKPLLLWGISGVISIVIMIVVGIFVTKKHNEKLKENQDVKLLEENKN